MATNSKPDCKYWEKCYQKNPAHHAKYNHPPKDDSKNLTPADRTEKRTPSPNLDAETQLKRQKKSPTPTESTGETSTEAPKSPREMDITEEYNEVMQNLSKSNYFELYQRRVRYSQKAEYLDLLKVPATFIRHKFLVEMPDDFFKFWEFCIFIAEEDQKPQTVFEKFGLKLVGPFDYYAGNFDEAALYAPGDYLRHWRFYYDPPEFQTVFVKDKTGIHYGYWRDDPKDKEELLLARNDAGKDCEFQFIAGNCFDAVLYFLEKDSGLTPFNRQAATAMKKSIESYAKEKGIEMNTLEQRQQKRNKIVVCKTFHKAGLVVPYERRSQQGYRPLLESDAVLKKILDRFQKAKGDEAFIAAAMEQLQPIITAANIANDECDFGTSIELGLDLFSSGHKELHPVITCLLVTGYSMVDRPQFIAIMKAHLENRRKDFHLSIFESE